MLPTNKIPKIRKWCICKVNEGIHPLFYGIKIQESENCTVTNYELYIISDDEIKEGDWFLNDLNQIKKCTSRDTEGYIDFEDGFNTKPSSCKKIIATTDTSLTWSNDNEIQILDYHFAKLPQPSQSFINKYIKSYNNGNIIDEISVEYEDYSKKGVCKESECNLECQNILQRPKVNQKDNTITITKLKDSWNRDEVKQLCWQAFIDFKCINGKIKPSEATKLIEPFNKWIEENL